MTTQIAAYSKIDAALATLETRFKSVLFDCKTPTGMSEAKQARKELRDYRLDLEEVRKQEKKDILERGRTVDGEANRIKLVLESLEDPIDAQIKLEEGRKEAERKAAVEAEAKRVAEEAAAKAREEQARINAANAEIARRQAELDAAERAHKERVAKEQAEAAEKLRVEQARLKAESDRVEKEKRDLAEKQLAAEREQLARERAAEALQRKHREEQENIEREKRRNAEEAERAAKEKEEAEAKAERDAKDAHERELKRQEMERADAYEILADFGQRFSKIVEFKKLIPVIREVLQAEKVRRKAIKK
jgi:hypothetical protein